MKNTNKKSILISGIALILLTVLFTFSQAQTAAYKRPTALPMNSGWSSVLSLNNFANFNKSPSVFSPFAAPIQTNRSLVVNTLTEHDDGACDEIDCTLREAVKYATAGANITFSVTGTIEMKDPAISIAKDLTITGPGAGSLTLSGNGNDGMNFYGASLFNISGGIVGISGLTMRDGTGDAFNTYDTFNGTYSYRNFGGAIYMSGGMVTVSGSTLSNNNTPYKGGAIYINGGSLTVTSSTISNNNIGAYNYGGGIYMGDGSVAITNSTISGNIAGFGAGIFSGGGTLSVANSTISGNTAKAALVADPNRPGTYYLDYGWGGGIMNGSGSVSVANCTISGNTAEGGNSTIIPGGGGIHNRASLTVVNSTITGNTGIHGGGINSISPSTLNLSNSIVAGNRNGNNQMDSRGGPEISGTVAAGDYNLVQDASGATLSGTHNITGQDPKLGVLANNGGPTKTHALFQSSPAIDAGDPNFNAANLPYDQRGAGFPRVENNRVDIGAFEADPFQTGSSLIVNTLTDHDDGDCGAIDCTLREAVKYASAGASITFSVNGTITLTSGDLVIAKNLTITGPGNAPGITVSGNNASRIFSVSVGTVNFSTLTLINGNSVGGGANSGTGGAIAVDQGTVVTVTNCTLSGNTTSVNGGAIRNGGTLTVTNSTFSGNTASGTGGAIRNNSTLTVSNSTFSGNTASTIGGGIYNNSTSLALNISNSIVAGNSAPTASDINGTVTSGDYNLVQSTSGATLSGTHNITGQDPKLGALTTANSGPTATMALLANSPAINAGNPNFDTTATPYDQRGSGFPRKIGNAIDIGAFEVQPPPAAPADLMITKSHTGNFSQGDISKTYSITVTNSGGTATGGTVTVTDTLPAGLTATGISGTGWTCTQATLTCTRTDALAAAGNYPAITLTVSVATNAPASVTNTATVSGGGDSNTANNTATDPTTINATATYTISGQLIYGTTPTGSAARGVPGVTLNASGTASATAASNSSGSFQLSGLGSGAYTVTASKSGDANRITANDALLIQQYGSFAADLTSNQMIAADTNNDSLVNTTDALYIQQYLAYVSTTTTNIIEQWKFLPGSRNYTLTSNQINQNYTAILVGEVDGDWVAPGTTNAPLQAASILSKTNDAATSATEISVNQLGIEKPRSEGEEVVKHSLSAAETATAAAVSSVTVSLPTGATSSTGTNLAIPINVSQLPALTDANVVKTYAFNVQYDASVLQYTGSDTTGTLSNSGVVCGQPPVDPTTSNRIVACNYTNLNGITGQGTLLKLNFTVIGTAGRQSALTFVSTSRQPNPFIFNTGDPQAATQNGGFTVLGTTAATVSISGRVLTMTGRGIMNVRLSLTDSAGQIRTATTTAFGYYHFEDIQSGTTYILSAVGKHYTFSQPIQVLNVNEETTEVNFIADSEKRVRKF